jgi:LPS export ABC transporter permease LptF/LPS export ABC transporter permease LptG
MRLLSRYIAGEINPSILLGILFYSSLFLIRSFFEVAELSLRHGIPFFKALFIVFLSFPAVLSVTVPMAVLYGVLLSVARMQGQNEILAFHALGISRRRIFIPILGCVLIFALLNAFLTIVLLPAGNSRLVQYRMELLQNSLTRSVQARTFIDAFPGKVIYINTASEDKRDWRSVFISDHAQPGLQQFTSARRGELYMNIPGDQIWLKLYDSETLALSDGQKYQVNRSSEQDLLLYPPYSEISVTYRKGFREKTLGELRADWSDRDPRTARLARVEFHKRWAIPATTLVFGILAFILAGRQRGKGATRSSVFVLSLLIIFSDYILLTLGENYGEAGKVHPVLAMWAPPAAFLLLGLLLALRAPLRNRGPRAGVRPGLRLFRADFSLGPALSRVFPFLVDGYLFRVWIPYLFLSMATITVLYVGVDFSQLSDDVQRHHVGARPVTMYYLFALPQIIYDFILPLSVLVATALALAALEKNRELSAMKSLGISWQRIGHTFLVSLLVFGTVLFFAGEHYLNLSNRRMMQYREMIKGKAAQPRAGRFFSRDLYLAGPSGWIYGYSNFDTRNNVLLGIQAFQFGANRRLERHAFSAEAQWADGRWVTRSGWQRVFAEDGTERYQELKNAVFPIPDGPTVFAQVLDEPRLMNVFQLSTYISNLKRIGYDPVEWEVRLWQKTFYPWFITLLVLASLVACLSGVSAGHLWSGLGKSIILGLILWAGAIAFGKLGELAVLPPLAAAVSPLFIFSCAGLYYFWGLRS